MKTLLRWAAGLSVALFFLGSAAARDCSAPTTMVSRMVCAYPNLKAADDEMASALQAALPLVGDQQKAFLERDQANWEADLETQCGENSVLEDHRGACLLDKIGQRTAYLSSSPQTGPGTKTRLVPWTFDQKSTAQLCTAQAEIYTFPVAAMGGGEGIFSDAARSIVVSLADDVYAKGDDLEPDDECFFSVDALITYAAPDLVAMTMSTYWDDRSAHGQADRYGVVVDLANAKQVAFGDVFSQEARQSLIKSCTASLRDARINAFTSDGDMSPQEAAALVDRDLADTYAATIADHVGDFRYWMIYADRVEISFPRQSAGANVEGDYACTFANAELASLAGNKPWIVK